jgi:hypothetical protein
MRNAIAPIMGMEKFLPALPTAGLEGRIATSLSPRDPARSAARSHGGFDQDPATMNTMLSIVLGRAPSRRFTKAELGD